jgi:hypothetical protein
MMRWAGHVTRMGSKNLKGNEHLEDAGVDERIILELI